MISVVIATDNDERTLGQALASLVPAAVDALVREVILADAGSADETLSIAEDAGARVVQAQGAAEARIAEACRAARSDWLLILEASVPAPHGWEPAARQHMERQAGKAAYWGRSGLAPFVTPAKAVLAPKALVDRDSAAAGWLRKLGGKAVALKIRR